MNSQEKEMASMRKLVEKLNSQISNLQKERDGLKRDLNTERNSAKDFENCMNEFQREKKSLNLINEELQKKINKSDSEVSKASIGIKKKDKEILELNEKIVNMECK